MTMQTEQLKPILEAAMMAAGTPLTIERMLELFDLTARPTANDIKAALASLAEEYEQRGGASGVKLIELASGFCFQVKADFAPWVKKLWEERPARYSRALLETLALIAYRQPITRAEIEDIRGVVVSTNIVKTLLEREWVRVVGHRDVPGKPALYATTKQFLDHFGLKTLAELPPLTELRDLDALNPQLNVQLEMTEAPVLEMNDSTQITVDEAESASTE